MDTLLAAARSTRPFCQCRGRPLNACRITTIYLILMLLNFGCKGSSKPVTEVTRWDREKVQTQIDLIDDLVFAQMQDADFSGSKQEYAVKNWRVLFDFFIGEQIEKFPKLIAVAYDRAIVSNCAQNENMKEWMNEQHSDCSFLFYCTDVWDWGTVSDVLVIAVLGGEIVSYRTFAQIPY